MTARRGAAVAWAGSRVLDDLAKHSARLPGPLQSLVYVYVFFLVRPSAMHSTSVSWRDFITADAFVYYRRWLQMLFETFWARFDEDLAAHARSDEPDPERWFHREWVRALFADAFGVGVNELPLSIVLSWYEQKAVAVLLTLLHLGITDIRLGPTLPAFVTPNVLQVLVDNFRIKPIGESAEADLAEILGAA